MIILAHDKKEFLNIEAKKRIQRGKNNRFD